MDMDKEIAALRAGLSGALVTASDAEYDQARKIFNGRITSRPLAIARCRGVPDVQTSLAWARAVGLPVSVRSGGHGVHGLAICDGGLVLDLRDMNDVTVDPSTGRARVGGGALWEKVYAVAAPHGLAPVGGTVNSVGVAGFTMGSGNAWLMRRHGLACDNVAAFELVLADGTVAQIDHSEPDLFWALKGGGGNFGVLTALTLQLHPVPARIWAGVTYFDANDAQRTLAGYRDIVETASRDTAAMWVFAPLPDDPSLPGPLRARNVALVPMLHVGDLKQGESALAGLRGLAPVIADTVAEVPFQEGIKIVNGVAPEGMLNYWRGGYLHALNDQAIEQALPVATACPEAGIQIWRMGGAVDDVPVESAAIPRADRRYFFGLASAWLGEERTERVMKQTDAAADAFAPWTAGACPNHVDRMGQAELRCALGDQVFDRLREIKRRVDPTNVFASTQNIEP